MKKAVIYVHGKDGNIEEAEHYKRFFDDEFEIIGFDYKSENPWDAKIEFTNYFNSMFHRYSKFYLIANSIGAYFSILSLSEKPIEKAMLISPIIDMECLILEMMRRENISEEELSLRKKVNTPSGEVLSWKYLSYVRNNPITWNIPSSILYGEKDNIISLDTISIFADKINADLTVMENGEHWFHTEEQVRFLDDWFKKNIGL